MRIALLGDDAETHALADAAAAAGHAIAWREAEQSAVDPTAWEALLDAETCDAVIVGPAGASPDLRARQIQELTKLGRPVLTTHPVVPSVISYFEIDMARTESGAVLQHYNPLALAPAVEQIQIPADGAAADAAPRRVEQIVATRYASDRSRLAVLWHFARDVELLARLAGRLNRIGAHASSDDAETAYASLSVQLIGPRQTPVRWSVEPPTSAAVALRVTLVGENGRTELEFDAEDRVLPADDASPAAIAVERFARAVATADAAASTWPAALDAMELADSIEISLRRGRMIDIHHRELTEQLAFKGVMSAVGCGVLVVLVPLMLAVGWIAGLVGIPLSHYWPHVLLALLAGFLGLQILPKFLASPPRQSGKSPADGGASTNPPRDSAD